MHFIKYEGDLKKLNGKKVRVKFYNYDPDPRQALINGYDDLTPVIHEGFLQQIKVYKKNSSIIPKFIKFKQINKTIENLINDDGSINRFCQVENCKNYLFCIFFDRIVSVEVLIDKQFTSLLK